jgi:hypothetical protein
VVPVTGTQLTQQLTQLSLNDPLGCLRIRDRFVRFLDQFQAAGVLQDVKCADGERATILVVGRRTRRFCQLNGIASPNFNLRVFHLSAANSNSTTTATKFIPNPANDEAEPHYGREFSSSRHPGGFLSARTAVGCTTLTEPYPHCGPGAKLGRLNLPQPLRQLGDVGRDAPGFVTREQLASGSSAGLVLAIHEGECFPLA